MVKYGLFASISAIVLALGFAAVSTRSVDAAEPCTHKEFKTKMVAAACAKGGQPAAKEAMQAMNKEKHISSCNKCHDKLKPEYTLKDDGLKLYKDTYKGDESAAATAVLGKK